MYASIISSRKMCGSNWFEFCNAVQVRGALKSAKSVFRLQRNVLEMYNFQCMVVLFYGKSAGSTPALPTMCDFAQKPEKFKQNGTNF